MRQSGIIIGGGVIGLSVGWQLARRGKAVEIFERNVAGRSASWVAAGMLAPQTEAGFEELELLTLGRTSLELYPRFLRELEEDSSVKVALRTEGTLMVGLDRDDVERLKFLFDFRKRIGLAVQWLSGTESREVEPFLSPNVIAAISIPGDHQVNNRELIEALKIAFQKRGGILHEGVQVRGIQIENSCVKAIQTTHGELVASKVILAAGCWSTEIEGIPKHLLPPVRPVKGQILTLRMNDSCKLSHVIRALDVYLAPKGDGRLIVGATNEEMGFDLSPTAGPVMELLEGAWEAVPSIYDLPIEEIQVGLRPGSRDNAPILGETDIVGLYYATGHYRSGILLAPITAYELSELVLRGKCSELLAPFQPSRFQSRHSGIEKANIKRES